MNIARPPGGFHIAWTSTVGLYLDQASEQHLRFGEVWGALIERLKFTAHREGEPMPQLGPGHKLLIVEGDPLYNLPRLTVGYKVLGDRVTIRLLRVS